MQAQTSQVSAPVLREGSEDAQHDDIQSTLGGVSKGPRESKAGAGQGHPHESVPISAPSVLGIQAVHSDVPGFLGPLSTLWKPAWS